MVFIDEAHLLAPHLAGSARDAETRRLGVATLSDHCARGRKRGLAPIIATQRLAKLATSVTSELQNFLIGLNVFDRDIARAADLIGFSVKDADMMRKLAPGEFYAMGPALSPVATLVKIHGSITEHFGATPTLQEASAIVGAEADKLLDLGALGETSHQARDASLVMKGTRALDAFLLDPAAVTAARIVQALRRISPNATTAADLSAHLAAEGEDVDSALDMLGAIQAIDTMPRGEGRIARLHARLRQRASDIPVVTLS
jgi:hypothetical protein